MKKANQQTIERLVGNLRGSHDQLTHLIQSDPEPMNTRVEPIISMHAAIRSKQRGIPPLIEQWLDEFGEEDYDGRGTVRFFFSRRSIRAMERAFGRRPVRRMSEYLDAYKVESVSDGQVITMGHRFKRVWRR